MTARALSGEFRRLAEACVVSQGRLDEVRAFDEFVWNNRAAIAAALEFTEEVESLGNDCICPPGLQDLVPTPPHTEPCKALARWREAVKEGR